MVSSRQNICDGFKDTIIPHAADQDIRIPSRGRPGTRIKRRANLATAGFKYNSHAIRQHIAAAGDGGRGSIQGNGRQHHVGHSEGIAGFNTLAGNGYRIFRQILNTAITAQYNRTSELNDLPCQALIKPHDHIARAVGSALQCPGEGASAVFSSVGNGHHPARHISLAIHSNAICIFAEAGKQGTQVFCTPLAIHEIDCGTVALACEGKLCIREIIAREMILARQIKSERGNAAAITQRQLRPGCSLNGIHLYILQNNNRIFCHRKGRFTADCGICYGQTPRHGNGLCLQRNLIQIHIRALCNGKAILSGCQGHRNSGLKQQFAGHMQICRQLK